MPGGHVCAARLAAATLQREIGPTQTACHVVRPPLFTILHLLHLSRGLPADFVYGKPPLQGEWGADRVLRGHYSPAEQQPDRGLGKPCPAAKGAQPLAREDSAQQAQQQEAQAQQGQQAQAQAQPAGSPVRAGGWRTHTNAAASPTLPLAAAGARRAAGARMAAPGRGRGQGEATITQLLRPIDSVYRGVNEDHFRWVPRLGNVGQQSECVSFFLAISASMAGCMWLGAVLWPQRRHCSALLACEGWGGPPLAGLEASGAFS